MRIDLQIFSTIPFIKNVRYLILIKIKFDTTRIINVKIVEYQNIEKKRCSNSKFGKLLSKFSYKTNYKFSRDIQIWMTINFKLRLQSIAHRVELFFATSTVCVFLRNRLPFPFIHLHRKDYCKQTIGSLWKQRIQNRSYILSNAGSIFWKSTQIREKF